GRLRVRRLHHRGSRPDAAETSCAATLLRARAVRGDAGDGDRDRAPYRPGTAEDRSAHSRKLGQRSALRLLPGPDPRTRGVGDVPLPGLAPQTAAVTPTGHGR